MAFQYTTPGVGTTQDELDAARAMAQRIRVMGEEYWVGNKRVRLAPLDKVLADIKALEIKLAAETGGQSSAGSAETKVYFRRPL